MHQRAPVDLDDLQGDRRYDGYSAYGLSKLGNLLFTYELAERLRGTGVTVNALHPGAVSTKLLHAGFRSSGGAARATAPAPPSTLPPRPTSRAVTGGYFVDERRRDLVAGELQPRAAGRLLELSERLTGLTGDDRGARRRLMSRRDHRRSRVLIGFTPGPAGRRR